MNIPEIDITIHLVKTLDHIKFNRNYGNSTVIINNNCYNIKENHLIFKHNGTELYIMPPSHDMFNKFKGVIDFHNYVLQQSTNGFDVIFMTQMHDITNNLIANIKK